MNAPDPEAPMKSCKQCGQPMASDAPEGLCSRCLLSAAIKETTTRSVSASEADTPDRQEIAARFPQLEILELLGRGGMGMVYKARQPRLDRLVALKVLSPEISQDAAFAERFIREARALARLNHPNIVGVFEFGEHDGLYYFIMEYVDGANLRQLIEAGTITPQEALAIVPKICEALQFAHEEGVMHRDIKPENILIDRKGRVKIADFGLAKILGRPVAGTNLTLSGMQLGTPRYMAPEQVENPAEVDHRADIYSLGVVFYEMLTGEVPMGRFAPPSEKVRVDVRLDEVVLRSLERDVQRRYQHASEVKSDVDRIAAEPDAPPAPPSAVSAERVLATPRRELLKTVLWLALLISAVMALSSTARTAAAPDGIPGKTYDIIVGVSDPWLLFHHGPAKDHGWRSRLNYHLVSWSFFALLLATSTAVALWRLIREERGRTRPDSMWWRRMLACDGLCLAVLLIALLVRGTPASLNASEPPARPQPVLDEAGRKFEAKVDAALAIRGDSTRHEALRAVALEAAGLGYPAAATRAVAKMSFTSVQDETAVKCAELLAAEQPVAAIEIANLISSDETRDAALRRIAAKRE